MHISCKFLHEILVKQKYFILFIYLFIFLLERAPLLGGSVQARLMGRGRPRPSTRQGPVGMTDETEGG